MDAGIREWIMGYTCGVCHAEVGSTRQAGVLVLARDAETRGSRTLLQARRYLCRPMA
jgi:hypothetical protein